MKQMLLLLIIVLTIVTNLSAQDAEGCKDHPLLTRLQDFYIESCVTNFDQIDFFDAKGEWIKVEGNLTLIKYTNNGSANKAPSFFQIMKNYANAITRAGGTKVFSDNIAACFDVKNNTGHYKIKVCCYGTYSDNDIVYELSVLKMDDMKQEITANEMLDALNKDGYIALNILFETGKSKIQTESQTIIDQIYDLLNANSALKISIEGHTDNVGNATGNKKLSEDRATTVLNTLVAKGIDKSRLTSVGWGQEKPVADNRSEDGRAKNRRVEIVKK